MVNFITSRILAMLRRPVCLYTGKGAQGLPVKATGQDRPQSAVFCINCELFWLLNNDNRHSFGSTRTSPEVVQTLPVCFFRYVHYLFVIARMHGYYKLRYN